MNIGSVDGGQELVITGEEDTAKPDMADQGIGPEINPFYEVLLLKNVVASDSKMLETTNIAGAEDSRYVIIPYKQTELDQPEFYISGEMLDFVKEGDCLVDSVVYNLNKGGGELKLFFGWCGVGAVC